MLLQQTTDKMAAKAAITATVRAVGKKRLIPTRAPLILVSILYEMIIVLIVYIVHVIMLNIFHFYMPYMTFLKNFKAEGRLNSIASFMHSCFRKADFFSLLKNNI